MELGRKITEKTKAVNVTWVSTGAGGKQAQFETTQRNCAPKETLQGTVDNLDYHSDMHGEIFCKK